MKAYVRTATDDKMLRKDPVHRVGSLFRFGGQHVLVTYRFLPVRFVEAVDISLSMDTASF